MQIQYNIKDDDKFTEDAYSEVVKELQVINERISEINSDHKGDMVISFLKDHCIQVSWIERNAKLAEVITSGSLETTNTESLFKSCRQNKSFLSDFEKSIRRYVH